jgi:hypothetical protein
VNSRTADQKSDPKRFSTELLPFAGDAICGIAEDSCSGDRPRATKENGLSEVEGLTQTAKATDARDSRLRSTEESVDEALALARAAAAC